MALLDHRCAVKCIKSRNPLFLQPHEIHACFVSLGYNMDRITRHEGKLDAV